MEKYINGLKAAVAAVVGLLTGLWGWMGWLVVGWVGCMVLDYISGSAAACKGGEWSSARAREGIWHKAGMIVVVLVAAGADLLLSIVLDHLQLVSLPVQYGGLVCPVVLVWYIVTELGSIVENAAAMGAPVPAWLAKLLAAAKKTVDKAGDGLSGEDDDGSD
ncbi:MAG: holin family protein [Candidatus Enterenecus sp.]